MVPFIVFIATYATYYLTSYPSVPGGDSGELISEACVSFLLSVSMDDFHNHVLSN